jgi:hypothetical protein
LDATFRGIFCKLNEGLSLQGSNSNKSALPVNERIIWDLIFLAPARDAEAALFLLLDFLFPVTGFSWNGGVRHRTPLVKETKIPGPLQRKKMAKLDAYLQWEDVLEASDTSL